MPIKHYTVEIRRYEPDDHFEIAFDSLLEVHTFLEKERGHGAYRAWVNDREVRNAYHGLSLDELMQAVDVKLAAAARRFAEFVSFPTNPATLRAHGVEL